MGEVYLAEDIALARPVAIKAIASGLAHDADARGRFLREARALADVAHPHVVRIYAFGEHAGLPYFVMEYVEGESLADRIRNAGPLQVEEALRIVWQVAEGLEAAWNRGIVHRD